MVRGLFYRLGEVVVLDSEDKEVCRRHFVFRPIDREHVRLAVYRYAIFAISFRPLTRSHHPDVFQGDRL